MYEDSTFKIAFRSICNVESKTSPMIPPYKVYQNYILKETSEKYILNF